MRRFHFTCFEWVSTGKLFHSPSFNLSNLCAVGTSEGPILLVSKLAQTIVPVCFLCGHKSPVTSLLMTLQTNTFISASSDGTIAAWHCDDGSCRFIFENILPSGFINLSISQYSCAQIWAWTVGQGAILLDLINGQIIKKILFPGLISFSLLTSLTCKYVSEDSLILVGHNKIDLFRFDDDNDVEHVKSFPINFKIGTRFVVSNFGLCKIEGDVFALYSPTTMDIIFYDKFTELDEGDSIANIKWDSQDLFCISSYYGKFRIYELRRINNGAMGSVHIESVHDFSYSAGFVDAFAFTKAEGIIFSSNSTSIVSMSSLKKWVKLVLPKEKKICCVPEIDEPLIIQSDFSSSFNLSNWGNPKAITKEFSISSKLIPMSQSSNFHDALEYNELAYRSDNNVKITSIACYFSYSNSLKDLQIIVGASNGALYFFTERSSFPISSSCDLQSPIIGITILPEVFLTRGHLAIAKDGSIALYRLTKLQFIYHADQFPVLSIYYHSTNLLIVHKSNGSFTIYNANSPYPLSQQTYLPTDSKLIWSNVNIQLNQSKVFSTLTVSIGNQSTFYGALQVTKLHSIPFNELNCDIIDTLELSYRLFNPHSTPNKNEKFNEKLFSFVLVGSKNIPTFFYPLFHLRGNRVLDASPYNAAIHYISYILISRKLGHDSNYLSKGENKTKITDFLSILTQLLFVNDETVQIISANCCANLIGTLSIQKCNDLMRQYLQYLNPKALANYDKFLLSIIAVEHIDFVQEEYQKQLFKYMVYTANSEHASSNLALIILLDGFKLWSTFMKTKERFFNLLIQILMKKQKNVFSNVEKVFSVVAATENESFFNSINDIINKSNGNLNVVKYLCNLCTNVSFNNVQTVGTKGTLNIALIGSNYSQYQKITQKELQLHSLTFKTVKGDGVFWLIGTNDGTIHVFKKNKFIFSKKLFEMPISLVSIGPSSKYAAALSEDEMKLKMFALKKGFMSNNCDVVSEAVLTGDGKFDITWSDPNSCHFYMIK
ncbi:hypothetical protein GPJ56_007123 [Histomonas meleagridis]|uniref:uncharacterized protein n=1 Tax=Histomonas meleagridis TaxID=135588 RepID=UPI0035593A80|nr:hypothetical protein GPJ56_007123 [Histomonas meleagridis]KAH0806214.1 hypothetical protein GO595_000902 [Histomonas meleagridis]